MSKKLLNIGPKFTKKCAKSGGIVVLFEDWIEFCAMRFPNSEIIDSNKNNYFIKFFGVLNVIFASLFKIPKADLIMLHGTYNDYQWIAPIIVFISKLFGKKVVLRKFAGDFWQHYEKQKGIKKNLLNYVLLNSELLFWETKHLVEYFSNEMPDKRSLWFTNVRHKEKCERNIEVPYHKRFVFLSRVDKTKGIDVLKAAMDNLGPEYSLDIYGPISGYSEEELSGINYHYKGAIDNSAVNSVLSNYDVLLLPSIWKAEGYPGIIIESFNAGVPVVASEIGGIPELIENGKNGFLVESGNVDSLVSAILTINEDNFSILSEGARNSFDNYNADIVNRKIAEELESI